jgi:soluble lytic murein transglycosylase-like protein
VKFSREHAYDVAIAAAAERWKVPVALIKAIIAQESEFQPRATALDRGDGARGGSYGLMQISLATARALGFRGAGQDLFDPAINVNLGARYLRDLLHEAAAGGYGVDSAISAYNAGNSAYRRGDGRRVGAIARATAAEAAHVPFINQDSYVRPVLELMRYFEQADTPDGAN